MGKYVYLMRIPAKFELLVRANSLEEARDKASEKSLSMFALDVVDKKMYIGHEDSDDQPIDGLLIESENLEADLRVAVERYCDEMGVKKTPESVENTLQSEEFIQWIENQINSEERELLFLFAQTMRRNN